MSELTNQCVTAFLYASDGLQMCWDIDPLNPWGSWSGSGAVEDMDNDDQMQVAFSINLGVPYNIVML